MINGIGNSLNNVVSGNSAQNVLRGGAGDDVIVAGLGSDHLWGDGDADQFLFGAIASPFHAIVPALHTSTAKKIKLRRDARSASIPNGMPAMP